MSRFLIADVTDIVIEGTAAWADDRQQLQRVGDA
jgi:hypothetical protein